MGAIRYVHTISHLKPIQVLGRIWFILHTPSIRYAPTLPERRRTGKWLQPPLKYSSLLSPSRFRFLNEAHDLSSSSDWNNPRWEKLWLYHLHYFDDLENRGTAPLFPKVAAGRLHFHPDVKLIPASDGCEAGKILLPGGREMHWRIEKGRGSLHETTWHPEFGLSIPNQCLEISFTDRETIALLSW